MSVIAMKDLLEAGVHFGHRTHRWNPKMRRFIFTERSGIHIIDLQQTLQQTESGYERVRDTVAKGGTVLFVGTKRQAEVVIRQEAERCGMPYVNLRWLGGTLTNWLTIRKRIQHLLTLERRWDAGEFATLIKKEQLEIQREIEKLNRRIGGLKTMKDLPDMVFVVDTIAEDLAVKEARKLNIPIIAMVDTNCNPDPIEHIIPSNDDAIRAVKLIVSTIANAAAEGSQTREITQADSGTITEAEKSDMEQYLGPSTLAKLQVEEEAAEATADTTADASAAAATDATADAAAKADEKAVADAAEANPKAEASPETEAASETEPKPETVAETDKS